MFSGRSLVNARAAFATSEGCPQVQTRETSAPKLTFRQAPRMSARRRSVVADCFLTRPATSDGSVSSPNFAALKGHMLTFPILGKRQIGVDARYSLAAQVESRRPGLARHDSSGRRNVSNREATSTF